MQLTRVLQVCTAWREETFAQTAMYTTTILQACQALPGARVCHDQADGREANQASMDETLHLLVLVRHQGVEVLICSFPAVPLGHPAQLQATGQGGRGGHTRNEPCAEPFVTEMTSIPFVLCLVHN